LVIRSRSEGGKQHRSAKGRSSTRTLVGGREEEIAFYTRAQRHRGKWAGRTETIGKGSREKHPKSPKRESREGHQTGGAKDSCKTTKEHPALKKTQKKTGSASPVRGPWIRQSKWYLFLSWGGVREGKTHEMGGIRRRKTLRTKQKKGKRGFGGGRWKKIQKEKKKNRILSREGPPKERIMLVGWG